MMDRSNRHRTKRNYKAKKVPKVPIKTYRWEDIRRARRRGGYPWTHLYKRPFTEKVDPDQFTMDAFRRSKSSSPMGKRSDRIEISEVSSWADYSGKTTPTLLHELINEPSEDVSARNSRPGSVVIEEYVDEDDKNLEDDVQIKEFQMDSAESSDNISQYLDKEEPAPAKTSSASRKDDIHGREERAKSEETAQRKRKLSAESGHSRYSLSKLGVIKKFQDAKNRIKIPKISFPTKKVTKKRTSPAKEDKPKKVPKNDQQKSSESGRVRKAAKPVYIHIPLKPPAGETDEFSHLEFEYKQNDNAKTAEFTKSKSVETEGAESDKIETKVPDVKEEKSPFSSLERGPRVTKKPPLKINPAFKQLLKDVRQLKDKELTENQLEIGEEGNNLKESDFEEEPAAATSIPVHREVTANETTEDVPMLSSETESPKEDVFDKLFEVSESKKEEEMSRNIRSKSAEPQNKRRMSLDSSYSRKSLSRLGIMKKIRDASEKIKSAFSMGSLRRKSSKKDEPQKEKEQEVKGKPKHIKRTSVIKAGQLDKPKKVEPVYIRIPLKPPEGQTDEFSHLADESAVVASVPETQAKDERTDSLDSTSPKNGDIQFIFLTPPSDDEILDKEPDIPETPSSSSDDILFFGSLKKLAEDAVEQVSPETKRNKLETVSEESDKGSSIDVEVEGAKESSEESAVANQEQSNTCQEIPVSPKTEGKVTVDVEDGLSEAPKTDEHLKSALKTTEIASVKRVSFKRKSKKPNDNEYETIERPKEEIENLVEEKHNDSQTKEVGSEVILQERLEGRTAILISDPNQFVSVDEEKSYLDKKVLNDTSLEKDYKCSDIPGDHEYELINPPGEVMLMTSSAEPPNVTVVGGGDTDPKVIISATDILDKPLEEKKKPFFQFGGMFHKDKGGSDREKSQERRSSGKDVANIQDETKASPEPNKFQAAFKQRAEQLKTKTHELKNKIHNIKRPNVHLPKAPEFKRPNFKIEKPKLNLRLPKIPDRATIHLPHISLPGARKTTVTRTVETRQYSTESNAGGSDQQTKRHKFDLSFGGTFPRFRKRKNVEQDTLFSTMPKSRNGKEKKSTATTSSASSGVRSLLRSEEELTGVAEALDFEETDRARVGYQDRATSIDIARSPDRRLPVDVAIDDEYERENQAINRADYLSRWQRGNFKERTDEGDDEEARIVGQLVKQRFGRSGQGYSVDEDEGGKTETLAERARREEEMMPQYIEEEEEEEEEEFDIRLMQNKQMVTDLDNLDDDRAGNIKDGYSSEGSGSMHRRGRLGKLDIDSDEFFVVHEIREGFQTPANALAQMNEYDPIGSNRSLPTQMLEPEEEPIRAIVTERKSIKKPKRKKTPHVSREQIPVDDEEVLETGTGTPSRPKRRSKRNKQKQERQEKIVPYQETIPLETHLLHGQRLDFPRESLGILGDDERDDQEFEMYENERKQARAHPDALPPSSHFKQSQMMDRGIFESVEPSAPPRKHRSLKSLTQSENGSFLDDAIALEDQIVQATTAPPRRPSRRSRSHTSSLSRASLPPSLRDTDSILTDEGYLIDNQQLPTYLIENQNFKKQQHAAQEVPWYTREDQERQPCVEEPCVQDLRDCMGYAIVDKSKARDPPLPPPRTPPRRTKRQIDPVEKFATVPRNVGTSHATPPVRPLRNYSTLSHVKSNRPGNGSSYENYYKENKENESEIGRYIEIDEEVNKDLVSGEVLQKMRQRPLPAPPRPPRKSKMTRKSLQDITSKENITSEEAKTFCFQEETVSTQTEPLPPDFICEDIQQEPTDTIITPRICETSRKPALPEIPAIQRFEIFDPRAADEGSECPPEIRRELITPTVYSFEETVTHGTLLVQPIDCSKVIPDHQLSRERLVPILRKPYDDEDEDTSEVPESFKQLRRPEGEGDGRPKSGDREEQTFMKVEKLQVTDLDVNRLTVNELLASKILVSDIDSATIATNEIQGKHGTIRLGDLELPPELLEQLLLRQQQLSDNRGRVGEQKKTPIADGTPEYPETLSQHRRGAVNSDIITSENTSSRSNQPQQDLLETPPPDPPQFQDFTEPVRDRFVLPGGDGVRGATAQEFSAESAPGFQQQADLCPEPPLPPPRGCTLEETAPNAPPRAPRRRSQQDFPSLATDSPVLPEHKTESTPADSLWSGREMLDPDVDDEPPPRPPQPHEGLYHFPSQPPASFYALRAKQFVDENIPTAPRRKRQHVATRSRPVSRSHSTSDEDTSSAAAPLRLSRPSSGRRFSDSSIPELSGRLVRACGSRINGALKRLIFHLTENLVRNADGNQDLHVFMIILLVLIAGLILLGYGEDRTVVHLHHWEYFNPPKDF